MFVGLFDHTIRVADDLPVQEGANQKWSEFLATSELTDDMPMMSWLKERGASYEPWVEIEHVNWSESILAQQVVGKAGFRFTDGDTALLFKLTFGGAV